MKYVGFYGNLYGCPIGSRLTTCPLYGFDNHSFAEKFRWFEALKITEKDAIVAHHSKCVRERFKNNITKG